MDQIDERKILWENVSALMRLRYKSENMSRLAAEAHVGPATMTRIKEQQTSIGTEALGKIAGALRVKAWQLLYPGLDVNRLDAQAGQPAEPEKPAIPSFYGQELANLFDELPNDRHLRIKAYQACTQILIAAGQPREPAPSVEPARSEAVKTQRA